MLAVLILSGCGGKKQAKVSPPPPPPMAAPATASIPPTVPATPGRPGAIRHPQVNGNRKGRTRRRAPSLFPFTRGGGIDSGRPGVAGTDGGTEAVVGGAMGGGGGGVTLACFLPPQPLSMSPASTSARIQMDKWPLSGGRT